MKFFPNRTQTAVSPTASAMPVARRVLTVAAVLALGSFFAARAELAKWVEGIDAATRLEAVFFRSILLPNGAVPVRRPPKETRPELTKLLAGAPNDAELYSLRALEDEQQLDFQAAEADWKKYADVAQDKLAARVALADFYHRRVKPRDEFNALAAAGRLSGPASDKFLPATEQRHWKVYARAIDLITEARLDPLLAVDEFNQWIARYPSELRLYTTYFNFMLAAEHDEVAANVIEAYKRAAPSDEEFPLEATAAMMERNGSAGRALDAYDKAFKPVWPDSLMKKYFELLKQSNGLRAYLENARAGVARNPVDLAPAARIFHYWKQQDNFAAAERALAEFRQRKDARHSAFTPVELSTLAHLYESTRNYDEAARYNYALYDAARNDDKTAAQALGALARLLLTAPDQAIRLGSGNLSMYRDVATMDPHPGFLNGALSLLLNSSNPEEKYSDEELNAGSYFRRAKGGELVSLYESRFPNGAQRAELREQVVDSYALYGASDAVIRAGVKFLADFPDAPNRAAVALRVADAYARTGKDAEELALYDTLLVEFAKRAGNVPLGQMPSPKPDNPDKPDKPAQEYAGVRSPDYARVLDRYVARLISLDRKEDALKLYRREIDRNASDPGLYDSMAAFLEQNNLGAETEAVYQRAIANFQDHTWEHKLARWYLRQKRQADVTKLTRDVIKIFSGTELDAYFREIVSPSQPLGPALYLQLNLYAHQRFPHYLAFARNLMSAYSSAPTADAAAYEALLRRHWYDADDLRMRFFERLSRTGRLDTELSLVNSMKPSADASPAAVRLVAEAEAWRGHFETAAPMFLALEANYPADKALGARTAAVYRSLGTIDPKMTDTAVGVEEKLAQFDPRDHHALTAIGEMEADRDRFDKARASWDKIPEIDPLKSDGYLEAATIFWDYYRYDDAMRWIAEGRKRLKQDSLFAYEAGAIYENQRDYARAIREYAKGAVAQVGSNSEQRLLLLARRPALKPQIDQLTAGLASDRNPAAGVFQLRVALLKNQNRRDDLEAFLTNVAGRANALETLVRVEDAARLDDFPKAQRLALERQIAVMTDPVEKLRLRLALARFEEGQGQTARGATVVDSVYRENPAILGIVRAAVDYHWRNKEPKRSIDVLEEAAGRASASYRTPFLIEAARKANESADYNRARTIVTAAMAGDPYNPEYIALKADTYARQGDDRGLRAYYDATIQGLQKDANVPAPRKIEQVATMRRALIPVLTRVKDFNAAVDQYIEIVNRYPEDDDVTREAAMYAQRNGAGARLHDYYVKTAAASPKDFHWPLVLGRIETQMEDYPTAIASYTRAAVVRPDRPELIRERLNLEERLLRFDEAAASAQKLYDLTYRNPQWMDKLAELRARQGRNADAVAALQKAWIDGRADAAGNYLTVAQKLETWNMLDEAHMFAEEAMKRKASEALQVWARILARQYQYDAVFLKLPALKSDVASQTVLTVSSIAANYPAAEKAKYAASIEKQPQRIALASGAGLDDLELKWRLAAAMARPGTAASNGHIDRIIEMQRTRLRFAELAAQLEAYDRTIVPPANSRHDFDTAEAFRAAGNTTGELRTLKRMVDRHEANGPTLDRYTQLLTAQPAKLIAAIAANPDQANAMVNYTLSHSSAAIAQQAIGARGQKNGPLWTQGYTALAGLYFSSFTPPVRAAFTNILGPMTVGARIAKPIDREEQLVGDLWFYFGGRYGEYLGAAKQPGADDFLPAMVEATPGRSEAYFTLAEYTGSAADYQYALELNTGRADAHDRLATIAMKEGRTADAVREWKLAVAALSRQMDRSRVPQKFWGDVSDTLRHVGAAKQLPALHDDLDKLLRTYVRRNGPFQIEGILASLMAASADPAAGVDWIVELSKSAAEPAQFLGMVAEQPWIPASQRDTLDRQTIASAQARVAEQFGEQRAHAQNQLQAWEIRYATFLVERTDSASLQSAASLVADAVKQGYDTRSAIELQIRIAARNGTLAAQLAKYPEPAPLESLSAAANILADRGDAASARRVLEFVYTHQLDAGVLAPVPFLGLAEVRIEEGNLPSAMALLRRMALIVGEPFSGLDPAAALLERTNHPAEAAEFLTALTKAEPWNAAAKQRLLEAQGGAPKTLRPWENLPFDPAAKEKALLAVIAAAPKTSTPRLLLISAAVAARHDALAVAGAKQLLPQYAREGAEYSDWEADAFLSAFDRTARVTAARDLGGAYQRLGDPRSALLYWRIAQHLGPNDAGRRAVAALQSLIETEARNELRRPVVTDDLDQDRLVRPKGGAR